MPSTGSRASKPPDQDRLPLDRPLLDNPPDQSGPNQSSLVQHSLEQTSLGQTARQEDSLEEPDQALANRDTPVIWIELLPLGVQYRIAEYVCEGIAGRDALALARTSPQQRHAVSAALEYFLVGNFATHAGELVEDWITAFEDVRVLELWEHPPNFQMLSSPELREVVLEDEPKQLEALTESCVDIGLIVFFARYGTPTHIIIRMFEEVSFSALEFEDIKGTFFENVDVSELATACYELRKLVVSTTASNQDAVADFIDGLPSLRLLMVTIDNVEIAFAKHLPKFGQRPNVTALGLYFDKVTWFESFNLQPQLKELWLMSDQGWGENEVLQFACVILDLPNLRELTIKLRPGGERFFPKISSLEKFHAYWNGEVDLSDGEQLYYKPEEGIISRMIEGMPLLTNLKLSLVRLTDEELVQIIKIVGNMIETFGVSLDRQDVPTMDRLLTIIRALANYVRRLEDFSLCQRNERGVPIYDPCEIPVTSQRKQEILLHLDRLHLRAPKALVGHVETSILDWPEEEAGMQKEFKEREDALQKSFALRRCRRGMNECGDHGHMCSLAKLLETGCEGLAEDRDAAIELYKQAVWMGDPGDAILNLWRLTEDPDDKSTEPRDGGAFQLVLELDKTRFKKLPLSAEIFLTGTGSTEANPAAAEKLLKLAVDRGFIHNCCLKLANLVRAGYNDVPPDPYRAFSLYHLAIDEDEDPDAMFMIAEMLKYGYGAEPRSPASARVYLERGVRLGWAPCINDLGVLLKEGYDDVPPDLERAAELYNYAIAEGNTIAMSNLASLYIDSSHGEASVTLRAIELYEQSISEGQNAHAMLMLGFVHQRGYGDVPPNDSRAKELYLQAIECGCFLAYSYLGSTVAYGYDDVPPDPNEAIRLFQLGIDTGDKEARGSALGAYGNLMEHGSAHIKPDPAKAVELYRGAIQDGEVRYLRELANLLDGGGPGVEPDPAEACRLYTRAVEEERDTVAMRELGELLERGYGDVEPNPYKAVKLYRRAMNAGDISACCFLGLTLERGYGDEPPDPEEARRMYQKGVDGGDPEAMCALGSLLERGFGSVRPDPLAAIDLYKRAIDAFNYPKALHYLGMTLENGYKDNAPDYSGAIDLYEQAAATIPMSKIQMAMLIENGYADSEPDLERARILYKEVIDAEHGRERLVISLAMYSLGRVTEKIAIDDSKLLDEATYWYRKAINTQENPCYLYALAALLVKGYGDVKPEIPQAVCLLRRCIKCTISSEPFFLLADCVRNGYGDVEPDPEEAETLEEDGCLILWKSLDINMWQ